MRRFCTYLLYLVLLSSVACSSSDSRHEFTYDGRAFQIIPAYEGQADYAEASSESSDYRTLWRKNVIEPYREECFSGGFQELSEGRVSQPILDFDRLSESVDLLRESDIEKVVESSLRESADALPDSGKTVCVFVAGDSDVRGSLESDVSAGGVASGSERFVVFVDPRRNWRDRTSYTVAHEYHHTVWTRFQTNGDSNAALTLNLAAYLVFEGRADSFATELYPELRSPFTDALSVEEKREMWRKMQRDLDSTDNELRNLYVYGSSEIPQWTAYTIGYDIVQSYIERNPDATYEDLLKLEPEEIISESGYKGP